MREPLQSNTKVVTFRCSFATRQRLKQLAEHHGKPLSMFIREMVEANARERALASPQVA